MYHIHPCCRNGMRNWRRWLSVTPISASLRTIVPNAVKFVRSSKLGFIYILKMIFFSARFLVGQNLYIYKQSRKSAATDWTRAITDWYNEVELFGEERVKPFK